MHNNIIITTEDRLLYEKLHKAIREEKRGVLINKAKQKFFNALICAIAIVIAIISPILIGDVTLSFIVLFLGACKLNDPPKMVHRSTNKKQIKNCHKNILLLTYNLCKIVC